MVYCYLIRVFVVFYLSLFIIGCSSTPQQMDVGENNYYTLSQDGVVTLSPHGGGKPRNDMAVTVEPDRLRALLSAFYYREPRSGLSSWFLGSEREVPLIQSVNLGRLSRAISRAFADSSSRDDIVVGLRQRRSDTFAASEGYRLSAFRVFVVDDRLNLLFGTVGESLDDSFRFATIERKARAQDLSRSFNRELVMKKAGSRSSPAEVVGKRVYYAGEQKEIKKVRNDWFALDLKEMSGESTRKASTTSETDSGDKSEKTPEADFQDRFKNRKEKLLRPEMMRI